MAAASLSLLKGKTATKAAETNTTTEEQAAPVVVEEQAPEAAPAEEDEVEVDIDTMTGPQLDELVKEHEIAVPTSWWKQENGVKKLTVPEKKAWLHANLSGEEGDEDGADEGTEPTPEPETQAQAPVTPATAAASTEIAAAPKKATKAAKASVKGEIVEPDELSDIVHEIQNLKEQPAKELVASLAEAAELTYFRLGGVLSLIQANGWFAPYSTFREFVEQEHGLHYRKAMYWLAIYNDLTEATIPWAKVKHLGWTKLKEIASILTLDNLDEWVKIAESNNVLQLVEIVGNAKKKANGGTAIADQTQNVAAVTTKTFKVHEDQKKTIEAALEKARETAATTVDTVALEFICLDFLGSKQKVSVKDQLIKLGVEKALEALGEAFPDVQLTAELPEELPE